MVQEHPTSKQQQQRQRQQQQQQHDEEVGHSFVSEAQKLSQHQRNNNDEQEQEKSTCSQLDSASPHSIVARQRKPSLVSLFVVLLNVSLNVTSFLIVLPTSRDYTESFDVNDRLAGLLVGLSPLINGAIQPILIPVFNRFQLKHIFYINCLLAMIGNVLYSLGDVANSYAMILIGRCILGVSGGPVFGTTYVSRATSVAARTKYMEYVSIGISSGYVLGPLLALVAEACVNSMHDNWDESNPIINSNTAPGWLMVILFILNLILFVVFFQEASKPDNSAKNANDDDGGGGGGGDDEKYTSSSDDMFEEVEEEEISRLEAKAGVSAKEGEQQEKQPPKTNKQFQIAVCYLFIAVAMANTGSFEIVMVFRGDSDWDFSIIQIAIMLAAFNAVTCLVPFVVKAEKWINIDRKGILWSFMGLAMASVWFFDYQNLNVPGDVTIFGIGGISMLLSAQWAKGYLFGLASKVPSPSHHQITMSFMASAYTFGRFLGTLVAPFLLDYNHGYGGFILCINASCCIFFGLFYRQMRGPDEKFITSLH